MNDTIVDWYVKYNRFYGYIEKFLYYRQKTKNDYRELAYMNALKTFRLFTPFFLVKKLSIIYISIYIYIELFIYEYVLG